jgi:hypothetical protein
VSLAQIEVVRIVSGSDLHSTGAEVAAHPGVCNNGNHAACRRLDDLHSVERSVAFVVGMDCDGHVAGHGFRAGGCDRDGVAGQCVAWPNDGVAEDPEFSVLLFMHHLQVGDGGLAARTPVHNVFAAIDQPLLIEADEGFFHRDR